QIRESGIPHTFLRPNSFMSNFLTHYRPHPDGNIRLPWGNGAVAHVDPRDVADVAAEALTTDTHLGKAYTLSGPEAITADQIASSISKATGQRIKYIDMPEEAMRQAMISSGMPPMMIEGLLNLWAAMKAGRLSDVTQTIPELLGRRARSFDQFARDHAGSWKTL
ncbi:MAG TPA: NmrA family NAD(P)-binding protein, partial [Vicinamibacterales bacterium]|nr:NmrA family NAD(P)-binding protein [Vicinamibacterales bacterium]